MKAYRVIVGTSTVDLEEQINAFLKMNWQLQGGVIVTNNRGAGSNDKFYLQAIVK